MLLVIGIVAVTLASAVFGVTQRQATFKATADILLTPLPAGDGTYFGLPLLRESNDPTRTAQTAASLLDSPQTAQATAVRIGPPYTRSRVQDDVVVEPKGQSNIVSVTGTAGDPDVAARLANTFVEEALQARTTTLRLLAARLITTLKDHPTPESTSRIAQLQALSAGSDPTMSSSQTAQRPGGPEGRQAWLVILLAGIAGFAIASGAALLAESANRRVRDEDELVKAFPLPVLARVPRLRRDRRRTAASSAVLPAPEAREAFRSLQVQLDEHVLDPGVSHSRVLLVTSASKDDGKTSCAIGLAMAFSDAGYRVLLIDFDVRKPDVARRLGLDDMSPGLTSLIGTPATRSVADLLLSPPYAPDLLVLPAGVENADVMLGVASTRRLPAILAQARKLADYVILDTPPLGEVSDALRVIAHADDVLLVGHPGRTRSDDLELTRQLIERSEVVPRGMVIVGAGKHSNYSYGT